MSLKAFWFCFVIEKLLYKHMPIGEYENIGKERDTICSHSDSDDFLKTLISELDKYVID